MAERITWEEMKTRYPGEWLMITDYDLDQSGRLKTGIVSSHSRNKTDIYSRPADTKTIAFRYTGESDFSGLRCHAGH
ncbi:MAG: hypothetical protein GXY14_00855 [Spirochaetes bacterium]|nr:hypothetical protein [Spirochaetota bacterium]